MMREISRKFPPTFHGLLLRYVMPFPRSWWDAPSINEYFADEKRNYGFLIRKPSEDKKHSARCQEGGTLVRQEKQKRRGLRRHTLIGSSSPAENRRLSAVDCLALLLSVRIAIGCFDLDGLLLAIPSYNERHFITGLFVSESAVYLDP